MTSSTTVATVADRTVEAFLAGHADTLADLCIDDVLVDLIVPHWRFQLGDRDSLRRVLAAEEFRPGRRVTWHERTDTAAGVLLEVETWAPIDGQQCKWHSLIHFRIDGDRVTQLVVYCSGIWDAATIAHQAAEAPMVRER